MLGNGQALLGMPDIDVLDIININVKTIDTEDGRGSDNCCTNKAIPQSTWHEQQYKNTMQETDRTEKCYKNIISKFNNTDKPTVNNKLSNTKDYFLLGPNLNSGKRASAEITHQLPRDFKDVFNGIGYFDGTFLLQLKANSKP